MIIKETRWSLFTLQLKKNETVLYIDMNFNELVIEEKIFKFFCKVSVNRNKSEIWSIFKLNKFLNNDRNWKRINQL